MRPPLRVKLDDDDDDSAGPGKERADVDADTRDEEARSSMLVTPKERCMVVSALGLRTVLKLAS